MTYLCPFLSYSECPMAHGACSAHCAIEADPPETHETPEDLSGVSA